MESEGNTDEDAGVYTFALSLPIMDSIRYQAIGVLHRIYDAKEFFSPSIDTIHFGETGHAMIIDGGGVVLRCPILPTGFRLTDTELIPLVTPMHNGWTEAGQLLFDRLPKLVPADDAQNLATFNFKRDVFEGPNDICGIGIVVLETGQAAQAL